MNQITSSDAQARPAWSRWTPLTGIAFVVFFIGSVVLSTVPPGDATDAKWVAAYATHGKQVQHLTTGICLVLAALCLVSFLTTLWTRVGDYGGPRKISPLPMVLAAMSAASIAAGGVAMAVVSGAALTSSTPIPNADVLRLANDIGFAFVGVAGMAAAALSIACLSFEAHATGFFGRRLLVFSIVVAVILLASIAFVPIVALLIWLVVVSIVLMRRAVDPQSPLTPAKVAAVGTP